MKVEVADREEKEHTWGGAVAADGVHKAGSAKIYFTTAAPTLQPDGATSLATADKGRPWLDSTNSVIKVHNGTTWSTPRGALFWGGNSGKTYKRDYLYSIGSWNMDATYAVSVAILGLSGPMVVGVKGMIQPDNISPRGAVSLDGGGYVITSVGTMRIFRLTNGIFDSPVYNSTGFNRGWITITCAS